MSRKRWILLGAVPVILIGLGAAFPFAFRAGSLYWAKHSARKIFSQFPQDSRRNLNATPMDVVLPESNPDTRSVENVRLKSYSIRIPRPTSRQENPKNVLLTYPRFQARILAPFSLAESDGAARQLHYHDFFDQMSACYHTRLDELDDQRDLPSLRRFVLLISIKPDRVPCLEEFQRPDMRGFLLDNVPGENRKTAEIYLPQFHAGCGVWFIDTGGLTLNDIHQYLAALRFEATN